MVMVRKKRDERVKWKRTTVGKIFGRQKSVQLFSPLCTDTKNLFERTRYLRLYQISRPEINFKFLRS